MSYKITLVGGGGKTTTMFQLAKHFYEQKKSVIITTTTNIAEFKEGDFKVNAKVILTGEGKFLTKSDIRQKIEETARWHLQKKGEQSIVVIASHIKDKKFKGLSLEQFECLDGLADIILTEGDGAKYLPIKVPEKHEPVIPPKTDEVLVCMGMDAISKKAADVCFRFETAKALFEFSDEHILTEADAADILTNELGGRKQVEDARISFVINKVDTSKRLQSAKLIEYHIIKKMQFYNKPYHAIYLTSYLEGEHYRPIAEYRKREQI